ncbi:MAG: IPTL-CTERM sorting domain-containing protein [Betaproteobacteria bacterium]
MIRFANRLLTPLRTVGLGVVFAFICAASSNVAAEVLAFWNPTGTVDSANPLAPASVSPNVVSAGNMSGGPGLTSPGLFANAYEFDNWAAGAFDANDYLQFSVTGNNVTYQSIAFNIYNNFDGQGSWEIRSVVDGFATALDAGTFTGIFAAGLPLTANVSAIGQQSGTVTFRLYTFNNSGTTSPLQRGIRGTAAGGTGLSVIGTAVPLVPVAVTQPVPALSHVALAVLVLLLVAFAFVMRRQQR